MTARQLELGTPKLCASVQDHVAWLMLNNPERRNAVSMDMWRGLAGAADAFDKDDDVRVVVIHGAGGKSFAAGADISEFENHRANAQQKEGYSELVSGALLALTRMKKPLIAMIQGYCIGGGLALALTADLRFANAASRFAIPAAKLGIGYEYEGVATLARLIGPSSTRDMLFSARLLHADEALRLGLVNFVDEDEQLEAHVREYAAGVAANAPLTIHAAKAAVLMFERYSGTDADRIVGALTARCHDSQDYKEGRTAFMEKRKPGFTGK